MIQRARPRPDRRTGAPGSSERNASPPEQKTHYIVVRQKDAFTIRLWDMWGDDHGEMLVEHKFTTPVQLLNFAATAQESIEPGDVADRESDAERNGEPRGWALDAVVFDPFEHHDDFCFDGGNPSEGSVCRCRCVDCRREHWPLNRPAPQES